MPIFEFVCKKCNNIFSEYIKDSETEIVKCECGNWAEKILSATNWHINGTCYNSNAPVNLKEKEKENEIKIQSKQLWEFKCIKCHNVDERLVYQKDKDIQKCNICR